MQRTSSVQYLVPNGTEEHNLTRFEQGALDIEPHKQWIKVDQCLFTVPDWQGRVCRVSTWGCLLVGGLVGCCSQRLRYYALLSLPAAALFYVGYKWSPGDGQTLRNVESTCETGLSGLDRENALFQIYGSLATTLRKRVDEDYQQVMKGYNSNYRPKTGEFTEWSEYEGAFLEQAYQKQFANHSGYTKLRQRIEEARARFTRNENILTILTRMSENLPPKEIPKFATSSAVSKAMPFYLASPYVIQEGQSVTVVYAMRRSSLADHV